MSKTAWRTEPTKVENLGDELWIGVKGQSSSEIAGSLRNIFRYSLQLLAIGVEHCLGKGGKPLYQLLINFEYYCDCLRSQSMTAKCHRREGKSPDHHLRSQM